MTRWAMGLVRGGPVVPLAVVALACAVVVLPHVSNYGLRVLTIAGVYALLALGYGFIFGHAGALSLAQGTFMGVGAYVSGILAVRYGIPFDLGLPASVGVPVLLAWLVARPVLRLQTHYFALATLLIGQIVLLVATQWESVTGGANGLGGVPAPALLGFSIIGRREQLLLVWGLVAGGAALARRIVSGRLGDAFALVRSHSQAARSVGIDTGSLRLTAFLLSAGFAGLAGSLYVHAIGVLSPDVLGFPVMITCLTIAVVGSRRRVAGAIAGAVLIIELPEWARVLRDDYLIAFGCILLLVIIVLPDGLVEAAERLLRQWWVPPPLVVPPTQTRLATVATANGGALLAVTDLSRRFGGVRALEDVALEMQAGSVLGLIGPNGSGKTTLLNVVTGIYPPDAGRVRLGGRDIAGEAPQVIAHSGVARTFQTPALVADLPAVDNVAVAWGAARLGLWSAMRNGQHDRVAARTMAMGLLERMGVAQYGLEAAGNLPPGIARLVEIARALATEPRLLLLDEPAAGLNETEQADLARRLSGLADDGIGLLVIEHNMGFLAPLADRLVCLDQGRVIATGTFREVQSDPDVIAAYLGPPA